MATVIIPHDIKRTLPPVTTVGVKGAAWNSARWGATTRPSRDRRGGADATRVRTLG